MEAGQKANGYNIKILEWLKNRRHLIALKGAGMGVRWFGDVNRRIDRKESPLLILASEHLKFILWRDQSRVILTWGTIGTTKGRGIITKTGWMYSQARSSIPGTNQEYWAPTALITHKTEFPCQERLHKKTKGNHIHLECRK